MTVVITSHQSEGPLGDVGSEKAEACVSARFAKGYDHAKKGPVAYRSRRPSQIAG